MRKDTYKRVFQPDKGSLLFVTAFDVDVNDWQRLLDYLSHEFVVAYSEDGIQKSVPSAAHALEARKASSVMVEVMLPGFAVNSHITTPNQVQLNILPEDVNSAEKAEAVFQLMIGIANALDKRVFLTPELGSASDDELRLRALCIAQPRDTSIQCRVT